MLSSILVMVTSEFTSIVKEAPYLLIQTGVHLAKVQSTIKANSDYLVRGLFPRTFFFLNYLDKLLHDIPSSLEPYPTILR